MDPISSSQPSNPEQGTSGCHSRAHLPTGKSKGRAVVALAQLTEQPQRRSRILGICLKTCCRSAGQEGVAKYSQYSQHSTFPPPLLYLFSLLFYHPGRFNATNISFLKTGLSAFSCALSILSDIKSTYCPKSSKYCIRLSVVTKQDSVTFFCCWKMALS